MSLIKNISTGIKPRPHFIGLYGPGGVGKTSFAASAPNPVFLGTDDGNDHMDVARFPMPKTWQDVKAAIGDLLMEDHPYQTLAIDTVNGLEPLVWAHVCREAKVSSIEDVDGGFGKGYIRAEEEWEEFYRSLKRLRMKMNVIVLGHSKIRNESDIYLGERYDRHVIKMDQRGADKFLEAVDCLLFANYEQFASKEKNAKKAKMRGEGRRRVFTEDRPAFKAKNRFNLPFEMDLSWDVFQSFASRPIPNSSPDKIAKLFAGIEADAVAYLVSIGWLLDGQSLADLMAKKREVILSRPDDFQKAMKEFSEKPTETEEENQTIEE
jgi:hypothetical protein